MNPLKNETGFTLVELLISILILSVVSTVLVSAIVVGLKSTDDSSNRFSVSHDAQIASEYFAKDVQSAVTVTVAGTSGLCGSGSGLVVSFGWADVTSTSTYVTATYRVAAPSNGQGLLTRYLCRGANPAVTNTVAHYVVAATSPAGYRVACPTSTSSTAACPSPSGSPTDVSLTLNTCYLLPGTSICRSGTNYSFTVSGSRRSQ